MPITYPTRVPTEDFKAHTTTRLVSLEFDYVSRRLVVVVEFGDIVAAKFVVNKHLPRRTLVMDGQDFRDFVEAVVGTRTLLRELELRILNYLITRGDETGTVV